MKYFHLLTLAAILCLTSCETVPAYDSSGQWRTTENGVTVWFPKAQIVTGQLWHGPVDAEKKAHGFGKLTAYNPDIAGDIFFGGGYYENTTTNEGKMVNGRFEGEVIARHSSSGKVQRDQYVNGEWVSGEWIHNGRTSTSSGSSGLSDGQLVGGMLGMAGIAGGDTGLAGAGLTMLSGNESGGLRQMADWATSTPGGTSGGTSGGAGTGAAAGAAGVSAPNGNLIDEWKLRGEVKASGDHMKYYIQAADQAFASYKKSGEAAYYKQHREYAELARDFHQRTGTKTQGYAR